MAKRSGKFMEGGADMSWPKGKKKSKEHKQKIRESLKRYCQTPEGKIKRSKAAKKNWQNSEYRKQRSEWLQNKWKEEEFRESVSKFQRSKVNSEETKEKMSKARIQFLKNNDFDWLKPSSIELKVKEQLDMLGIRYIQQKMIVFENRIFYLDFYIPHLRLVIECNGDYWHSLPERVERDKILEKYVKSTGRDIIFIWEHEINDDWFWVGDYIEA